MDDVNERTDMNKPDVNKPDVNKQGRTR